MTESRNLNSGFLHTSFVDFDFTVAKIITILPTGYRAQLRSLNIQFLLQTTRKKQPLFCDATTVVVLYVWRVAERRL